jgi:predicted  nucleic acid-binding Zn-ribbon protein
MSIESKIEKIKAEKESAIDALTLYLDSIYNMTDRFFDIKIKEDGSTERVLKEGLEPDMKIEKFIMELNNDASEYEKIRGKLKNDDFNL